MTDPVTLLTIAAAGLAGLAIVTAAALHGWTGWLRLQHAALRPMGADDEAGPGHRIELADLRERVRKLEAIAAGVEL